MKLEDPGQMQPQELRNTLQKKLHWRSLSIDARRVLAKQLLIDLRRLYHDLT
jgi:hypothetical protein